MDSKEQIMKDYNELDSLEDSQSNNNKKKKKKFSIWLILLIVCILLIIGGLVFFFLFALKPKALLVNGVDKMLGSFYTIVEPLRMDYNIPNNYSVTNSTKVTYNGEDESMKNLFDNMQLNANYMYDGSNKKAYLDVDSNLAGSNLNVDYYVNDVEQFISLENITNGYIKLEDFPRSIFMSSNFTNEDINRIYNKTANSLENSIEESWVSRNISISSGTATVTLTLSKKNYNTVLNNLKNDLFKDSKVLEFLTRMYGEDYVIELRDMDLTNTDEEDIKDYLTVIVEQSIIQDDLKKVEFITKDTNVTNRFSFINNNGDITITSYTDGEITSEAKLKIDGKNFNLILNSDQDNPSTLKGSEADGFYTYTLTTLTVPQTSLDATDSALIGPAPSQNFEITYKFKNTIGANVTYENSIGINYDDLNLVIDSTGTIASLGQEINVDTSNYIPYEEVNMEEFETNLTNVLMPFLMVLYGDGASVNG